MKRQISLFAALLALALPRAQANELSNNITVKGGTIVEQGDDVVITYTADQIAADGEGSLKFAFGSATARVLAVGGGGGGGSSNQTLPRYGGGGGGGAGGFVDVAGLTFSGQYQISVGRGGANAAMKTHAEGGDGGDTTITQGGAQVAGIAVAKGGGGGGAGGSKKTSGVLTTTYTGRGRDGGSGGGGSMTWTSASTGEINAGGDPEEGQGSAGGGPTVANDAYRLGGGGGGAGGLGGNVTTYNQSAGAPGGPGKTSDITGKPLPYAGGGAGGIAYKPSTAWPVTAGASGGGGASGDGNYTGSRDGKNGLGGGGGGGNSWFDSGRGGDGVLIIRLTDYVGKVKLPAVTSFVYDGNAKTVAEDNEMYTVSDVTSETNVGTYKATLTLTAAGASVGWDDGNPAQTRPLTWSITPQRVTLPLAEGATPSFAYDGTAQTPFASPDWTLYEVTTGTASATNVRPYTCTLKLKNANLCWDDATQSTANKTWTWSITPQLVTKPVYTETTWAYAEAPKGTPVARTVLTLTPGTQLVAGSDALTQTQAGVYTSRIELVDEANMTWTDGTTDPLVVTWSITKVYNQIHGFRMAGWQIGSTPSTPRVESVDYGLVSAVTFTYGDSPRGPWQTERLAGGGYHYARAHLAGGANYDAAEEIVQYYVWQHPSEVFTDFVDFTVSGYTDTATLTDVPILVRLAEPTVDASGLITGGLAGFAYDRVTRDEFDTQIRFVQPGATPADDKMLAFDIEAWNPEGESQVWVKLAELQPGTTFRMYWHAKNGDPMSANDPQEVWSDYAGVWHMNTTVDATGHSPNGRFGDFARPTEDGAIGSAYGSRASGRKGAILTIESNETLNALDKNNGFTVSMWVRLSTMETLWAYLFSRKANDLGDGLGAQFRGGAQTSTGGTAAALCTYVNTGNTTRTIDPQLTVGEWTRLDFSYGPGTALYVWINGQEQHWTRDDYAITGPTDLDFAIGGFPTDAHGLFNGDIDEVRIWNSASLPATATRLRAEIANVKDANYVTHGLVNREGAWVNYWTTRPALAKREWEQGELTPEAVTLGSLKAGAVRAVYVTLPAETVTNTTLQTAGGLYRLVCDMKPSETETYVLYGGPATFDYAVIGHTWYDDLGGTAGGRILLGNNDTMADHVVTGQARWETDATLPTYWEHDTTTPYALLRNADVGSNHTLYHRTGADTVEVLWRLKDVRLGSAYPNNGTPASGRNYLPYTATGSARTGATATLGTTEVTYLILRNEANATIYSPCYTNGIGTVYVDAVNWVTTDTESWVVLEKATVTTRGEAPTDEQCEFGGDPYYYLSHTDGGAELAENEDMWVPVQPIVLFKAKGADHFIVDTTQTRTDGGVDLRATDGGADAFYRLALPVNERGPVRFRLRRPEKSGAGHIDYSNLILLDNILVSPPAMRADLTAVGAYDETATGKQTLGQACAFDTPFPARTDREVRGRAQISYTITPGVMDPVDTSTFVSAARLHYRWRYLNQSFDPPKEGAADRWNTVYLDHTSIQDGVLTSLRPLVFPNAVGDLEWFYDLTLQAPTYKFVDYSGLTFAQPTGAYSEEARAVTNRMTVAAGDRLASGGTDWFVRLREGKSDWQKMQVVIEADTTTGEHLDRIVGTYDMEIVDDNMWRVFVNVPTNSEGTCTFHFRGLNRQTGAPTALDENETTYGLSKPGQTALIPTSGQLTENGAPVAFTLDHAAGYLEFKMSDRYLTFQVGRAEYQDFNFWNDAHTEGNRFVVNATDTNSVNIAEMQILKAPTGAWPLFEATRHEAWDEYFEVADYAATDGRFVKDIFHTSHETPFGWQAQNITFVSENFVKNDTTEQKTKSGMAGKLLGGGTGLMDFSSAEAPAGIEKIDVNVRIGQSATFSGITYTKAAYDAENYTFFAAATMSHATKDDGTQPGDMAVGASLSLVGYYDPGIGCYEARVSRLFTDRKLRIEVYKWKVNGESQWTVERLAWNDIDASCWTDETTGGTPTLPRERKYHGLFLSLDTDDPIHPTKTHIICGLSNAQKIDVDAPWKSVSYKEGDGDRDSVSWNGIIVDDTRAPYAWGSYGVMSKDCPAQFLLPAHMNEPYTGVTTLGDGSDAMRDGGWWFHGRKLTLSNSGGDVFSFEHDRDTLENPRKWNLIADRCEPFMVPYTNSSGIVYTTWKGLHAPTDLVQDLDLFVKKRGQNDSQWVKKGTVHARSYGFVKETYDLKLPGQWDVRLATGAKAIDVVVDNVTQHKWQADDLPREKTVESAFYYAQGYVLTNTAAKTNFVRLQPARAEEDRPVSIQSPVMDGLGKLTFTYRDVDPNAEIWVQVATNKVHGNMSGEGGYNSSIRSCELGEDEPLGTWITVARFKATDAVDEDHRLDVNTTGTGAKSVYLGWHNHPNRPLKGVWRLFVPPAVVTASHATSDVAYGQLTVTALTCTDEPGFSDRSWRGWNMRTIGTPTDGEKRMNLVDMKIADGGVGLVGALNNSVNDVYYQEALVKEGDPVWERLRQSYPAIYSPLLRPVNRRSGVGSVTFKARLYSTTGLPETAGGGFVNVYGSKDPTKTGEDDWTLLATHEIRGSVFSNYTWSAGNDLYTAVKLEVHDTSAKTKDAAFDRIVLDEIVIGEKVPPTINFEYARPFRNNLFTPTEITDILSPAEQPLAGESWGVQTKLSLQQLTDEIDVEKGFEVYFSHKRGADDWGYGTWGASAEKVKLVQVGEASNLVFRSVGDSPKSLVEPAVKGGEIVQFMLTVKYFDRGGKSDEITMDASWQQPDWFYPLDYNEKNGAYDDEKKFAAYTVLDTVSPGRAWINEVSWNDGVTAQNKGAEVVTNQFIEVCVPSGVDLTNWKLRVTDRNERSGIFAVFGDTAHQIPAKKVSPYAVNGYEFLVLQSPKTAAAGGLRYPGETEPAADGTWYETSLGDDVKGGTLKYGSPYQFELIRPSGVIEHQFVLDGTNTLARYPDWRAPYDGTNLVARLNDDLSPLRFYAGSEVARKADGKTFASAGVTGGDGTGADRAYWPGGEHTWAEGLGFTPGRLNEGQAIPEGWFLPPNGTNSWVYFTLTTDRLAQRVGDETSSSILVVVPQGRTTNVTYTVANWHEAAVKVNGADALTGATGTFPFSLTPTGTTYVTASAAPQNLLAEKYHLTAENPFTPAVLKWLETKYPDASAEDIRLARFKGLQNTDLVDWIELTDMYWLDIPPVPVTEEEKLTNGGTNWWLRAGIDKFGRDHIIERQVAGETQLYTNKQVDVTMYVSNACTQVVWAPEKLQGLDNAVSTDERLWEGGVSFKLKGKLKLSSSDDFLPFRVFTFVPGSFSGPAGDATLTPTLPPYTARIDILDPFKSPIGVNYGWDLHPNTSAYFRWALDTKEYPYTTEKLKADSTYTK